MVRKARAVWRGTGKDGSGHLTADSGVLSSTPYSFKTRFENEKGTNPGCVTLGRSGARRQREQGSTESHRNASRANLALGNRHP